MSVAAPNWRERASVIRPDGRAWIDGRPVNAASGATFEDCSAIDGRAITAVAAGDAADVDVAVAAARRAFESGDWSRAPLRERKRVLRRFAELVAQQRDELALLETLDVGKPIRESLAVDVPGAARCIEWFAETVDKQYGEIAPTDPGSIALITREPLGVVGAVVPWNYPLIISAWKIAPALAAGNSVVLKPAEQSPLTALVLARLATEAGLPDGVLNVVPGFGPTAGAALGRHLDVDKIAFTGSGEVGRHFLAYAGESNMKSVSLECGGKSPQVIFADAPDLDAAAACVALGIFYNQGETCNAGSRLLVDHRIADDFTAAVAREGEALQLGDPLDPTTAVGALVDRDQFERVSRYVQLGITEGAHVVSGGARVREDLGGYYFAPTVLAGATNAMRVAREEIFGPVLVSIPFSDEAEAVALANDSEFGLAAGVWTADLRRAHRVAAALRVGTVWVNTFDASDVTTPFGGMKRSGFGRDRSVHALEEYSQLKTTWLDLH